MRFARRHLSKVFAVSVCLGFFLPGAPARAASGSVSDGAKVEKVTRRDQLCVGALAEGALGDYVLENGLVRVVVAGERKRDDAIPAGAIIDVGRSPRYIDPIGAVFPAYGPQSERHVRLASIAALDAKDLPAGHAGLEIVHHHKRYEGFTYRTRVELAPSSPVLRLSTTLDNKSGRRLPNLFPTDVVLFGALRPFAPRHGFIHASGDHRAPWAGAYAYFEDVQLGLAGKTADVTLSTLFAADPRDLRGAVVYDARRDLEDGESMTWERSIVVAGRDFGLVSDTYYRMRGLPVATVEGVVRDKTTTSVVVADCPVYVQHNTARGVTPKAIAMTRTDDEGRYRLSVPPGQAFPRPMAPLRPAVYGAHSTPPLEAGQTIEHDLKVAPKFEISYRVVDASTGKPCPAKLTFVPVPPTKPVDFGPGDGPAARNSVCVAEGDGVVAAPQGAYQVVVSRGPEYNRVRVPLTVKPDKKMAVFAKLERVVDTTGYVSVALGAMTEASRDGLLSPAERLVTAAAEGVELVVTGDDGVVTDLDADPTARRLAPWVKAVAGKRIRLSNDGRPGDFLVFPVDPSRDHAPLTKAERAAADSVALTALLRKHYPKALIQACKPLDGDIGLFSGAGYDVDKRPNRRVLPPADKVSRDFDLLETWWTPAPETAIAGSQLAQALIESGRTVALSAGSPAPWAGADEIGYPRVYVASSTDDPAKIDAEEIVGNLKAGRVLITNGPFARFSVHGKTAGETIDDTSGELECKLRLERPNWSSARTIRTLVNGAGLQTGILPPKDDVILFPDQESKDSPFYKVTLIQPGQDSVIQFDARGVESQAPVLSPSPTKEGAPLPYCATGFIYLDADGDGRFRPGGDGKKTGE